MTMVQNAGGRLAQFWGDKTQAETNKQICVNNGPFTQYKFGKILNCNVITCILINRKIDIHTTFTLYSLISSYKYFIFIPLCDHISISGSNQKDHQNFCPQTLTIQCSVVITICLIYGRKESNTIL